jgi:hypothetical protein
MPSLPGTEQSIAWQAHIGGFVAGLILFALFDPVPPHSEIETGDHTCLERTGRASPEPSKRSRGNPAGGNSSGSTRLRGDPFPLGPRQGTNGR